ncbi:hypothetical protein CPLU01_03019 [Colletotrichum plurivorum]|uniref:Uncharacterized protein n=1 Tax=Colletotrichum plurivorum TaxID=2175906 RepID=A0A8H6NLV2_9PEZI|nr:hypothetical protein CPLU01_03019 [Colletotrichum plurivorum]
MCPSPPLNMAMSSASSIDAAESGRGTQGGVGTTPPPCRRCAPEIEPEDKESLHGLRESIDSRPNLSELRRVATGAPSCADSETGRIPLKDKVKGLHLNSTPAQLYHDKSPSTPIQKQIRYDFPFDKHKNDPIVDLSVVTMKRSTTKSIDDEGMVSWTGAISGFHVWPAPGADTHVRPTRRADEALHACRAYEA